MMRMKAEGSLSSILYKPFFILLLLGGLFSLIWLRSSIVSMTYSLRTLEEKSMEARRDMKVLMAERANLMAVSRVSSTLNNGVHTGAGLGSMAESGYVMPDRARVVTVRKNSSAEPRKASLRIGAGR